MNEAWKDRYHKRPHVAPPHVLQQDQDSTGIFVNKLYAPLLPRDKKARILDIGCGRGYFLLALRDLGYTDIHGVELNPNSAELWKRLDLSVACEDAASFLRRNQGGFDCIIATKFLEHFKKDELFELLDLIREALRPGGLLIGQVPNANCFGFGKIRYCDPTHEMAFTPDALWHILNTTGFKEVAFYPEGPVVTGARSLLRWLIWHGLFTPLARLYLFAESYSHQAPILTLNLIFRATL